ncbi:MAG: class I SAM-dependent methyltransferase [bacterium]|nr:class I SAM-dependent methyltransferase [bacterium]
MAGLYANPSLYDILHTPGTAGEVDVLEGIEAKCGHPGGRWYEPACGTGRYLRVALRRGRRVTGYDSDPGMVAYARQRLGKRVFSGSMTDAEAPGGLSGSVGLAFNLVNTVRHLESDRDLLAHLDQVARLLGPGGLYVVGISLTDYATAEDDEDVWDAARGRCRVIQIVNYLPPAPGSRVETVVSHLLVRRPGGTEHYDDSYGLRTYDTRQWRRVVGRSALRRAASLDSWGRPLPLGPANYQLEILTHKK